MTGFHREKAARHTCSTAKDSGNRSQRELLPPAGDPHQSDSSTDAQKKSRDFFSLYSRLFRPTNPTRKSESQMTEFVFDAATDIRTLRVENLTIVSHRYKNIEPILATAEGATVGAEHDAVVCCRWTTFPFLQRRGTQHQRASELTPVVGKPIPRPSRQYCDCSCNLTGS